MKQEALRLLKSLTNAHSVSGFEDELRELFQQELSSYGECVSDKLGSVACVKKAAGPRVLLAGHMDEVGFMVQSITADGFIQFVSLGGWWTHTLLSQRVTVLNKDNTPVLGVISSQPPHFLPESKRKQVLPVESLFIDIGASSREEVIRDFKIDLGCPIAPATEFAAMAKKDYYLAKAFDNRVGMACAIQAFKLLAGTPLDCELVAVGTAQEEVGLRGAKPLARMLKPDLVIVLEGSPADDSPGFNRNVSQGKVGAGVQIRRFDPTAICNPRLADFVVEVARENKIEHQQAVRRSGGTDAGSFSLMNFGVPTVVLGTPARYIHSHNSMININDYLSKVELCVELVKALNSSKVNAFTQFLS